MGVGEATLGWHTGKEATSSSLSIWVLGFLVGDVFHSDLCLALVGILMALAVFAI